MASDRQFTWDPNFPGFGLQTTKTGHQSFIYQYRAGTVSRRMKLDGSWFRFESLRVGKPTQREGHMFQIARHRVHGTDGVQPHLARHQ